MKLSKEFLALTVEVQFGGGGDNPQMMGFYQAIKPFKDYREMKVSHKLGENIYVSI